MLWIRYTLAMGMLRPTYVCSRLLIDYASAEDSGTAWQGYVLAVLMFVVQMIKSVLFNFSFWSSQVAGMQIKTMLIAAIYKKVCSYYVLRREPLWPSVKCLAGSSSLLMFLFKSCSRKTLSCYCVTLSHLPPRPPFATSGYFFF